MVFQVSKSLVVHGRASSMGRYPDRVSQHHLLLQCAQKVCKNCVFIVCCSISDQNSDLPRWQYCFSRCRGALWHRWSILLGWKGIQVEAVCIIRHSSGLRKCIRSLTLHNWPEHWLAVTTILFFFQVSRSLVVYGRAYSMGGTVSRWSLLALCATAVCSESVYSWLIQYKWPEHRLAFIKKLVFQFWKNCLQLSIAIS